MGDSELMPTRLRPSRMLSSETVARAILVEKLVRRPTARPGKAAITLSSRTAEETVNSLHDHVGPHLVSLRALSDHAIPLIDQMGNEKKCFIPPWSVLEPIYHINMLSST